jgi:hypothetical protein
MPPLPSTFAFSFAPSYRGPARVFGIREADALVTVSDDDLTARFGRWHVRTPLANIVRVDITGPYAYLKTVGPAHLGFTDRGLTFASNGYRGVLLEFAQPIRGIDPRGLIKHPNLTLTVADYRGLAQLLEERLGQR